MVQFYYAPCTIHLGIVQFHYAQCTIQLGMVQFNYARDIIHLGMLQVHYAPNTIHQGMLQFDYAPCAIHLVIVQFHNEPCTNNLGIVQFNYTPCTIDNITTYFTQLLWTMHLGYCNSSLEHPSCKFLLSMVDNQNAPCTLVWCSTPIHPILFTMVWCTSIMHYAPCSLVRCTSTMHHAPWHSGLPLYIQQLGILHFHHAEWSVNVGIVQCIYANYNLVQCTSTIQLVVCVLVRCTSSMNRTPWYASVPQWTTHGAH